MGRVEREGEVRGGAIDAFGGIEFDLHHLDLENF